MCEGVGRWMRFWGRGEAMTDQTFLVRPTHISKVQEESSLMPFVFPFIVMLFVPAAIGAAVTFIQLMQLEYKSHRSAWEQDGRPSVYPWWSPEEKSSYLASQKLVWVWLLSTPDWMLDDFRALVLVKRIRVLTLVWGIGLLVAAIVQSAIGMPRHGG